MFPLFVSSDLTTYPRSLALADSSFHMLRDDAGGQAKFTMVDPVRQLSIDAGQTGIRANLATNGAIENTMAFPGLLTNEPLLPQWSAIVATIANGSGHIDEVAIGSTGFAGAQASANQLREMTVIYGVKRVHLAHDSITSYLGALGTSKGAVVAVGTGVVTLAVGDTKTARVDGWGNLLGDAGSGYWIGRAALEAVLRAHDGRGPATQLSDVVHSDFPDIERAYIELQSDPDRVRRIAAYARNVSEMAETDEVAARICLQAAKELALSVITALELVGEATVPAPLVCGLGGVLQGKEIATRFATELRQLWPTAEIRDSKGSGLDGAGALTDVPVTSALYDHIVRA